MSVEVWDHDELLGLASERIVEYIDNLEARIERADAVIRDTAAYEGSQQARIEALESKLPWETTEACADALREQLAARAEDAAMADELARAAHAMADALDRCDDALSGVFVFLYAHGMPYDGPTYIVERRVLCETLARYDATKGVGHE